MNSQLPARGTQLELRGVRGDKYTPNLNIPRTREPISKLYICRSERVCCSGGKGSFSGLGVFSYTPYTPKTTSQEITEIWPRNPGSTRTRRERIEDPNRHETPVGKREKSLFENGRDLPVPRVHEYPDPGQFWKTRAPSHLPDIPITSGRRWAASP